MIQVGNNVAGTWAALKIIDNEANLRHQAVYRVVMVPGEAAVVLCAVGAF